MINVLIPYLSLLYHPPSLSLLYHLPPFLSSITSLPFSPLSPPSLSLLYHLPPFLSSITSLPFSPLSSSSLSLFYHLPPFLSSTLVSMSSTSSNGLDSTLPDQQLWSPKECGEVFLQRSDTGCTCDRYIANTVYLVTLSQLMHTLNIFMLCVRLSVHYASPPRCLDKLF